MTGGAQVLITLYGQRLFPISPGRGALSISLLTACSGLGTALGPVIARRAVGHSARGMYGAIAAGYLLGGAFFLALGSARSLESAGAALFFCRMGGSTLWVFNPVLLQRAAADRYRGRVFAAEGALFTLSRPVPVMPSARRWTTASPVRWGLSNGSNRPVCRPCLGP